MKTIGGICLVIVLGAFALVGLSFYMHSKLTLQPHENTTAEESKTLPVCNFGNPIEDYRMEQLGYCKERTQ